MVKNVSIARYIDAYKNGIDITGDMEPTRELLVAAAQVGDLELARYLLRYGIKNSEAALVAITMNDLPMFKLLTSYNNGHHNMTIYSAQLGRAEILRYLVESKRADCRALAVAVKNGHVEATRILADYCETKRIDDLVQIAYDNSNIDIVRILLQRGGDSEMIFTRALKDNNIGMIDALVDADRIPDKAVFRAMQSNESIANYLIQRGYYDSDSLLRALSKGDLETSSLLIVNGASHPDAYSRAVLTNNIDLLSLMMNKRLPNPEHGLVVAAGKGMFKVVRYLVERGVPYEQAILEAEENGHERVLQYLLGLE